MADETRTRTTTALAACAVAVAVLLAGCASGTRSGGSGSGGFSGRDGPGTNIPPDLDRVPDAEPRIEPIRSSGGTSKPYTVLGRGYAPITDDRPFRESGLASWYGRKFHAASTSSGEPYDMYAMTAAHKTLPLPSYVRVRNPSNGREVIVRVNDRGPFVDGRVIDLSYTAALKLDLLRGVAPVEIERITNEDIRTGAWRRDDGTAYASATPVPVVPVRVPSSRTASAQQPVPVPAQWTTSVATNSNDMPPPASTMPVVPQTPMAATLPPGTGAEPESAQLPPSVPPSRQAIMVTDLAPLQAAPSSPPLPAGTPPPSTALQGFWVQLGAFRERDGAESLMSQAARGLPSLAPQLRVFSEAGTHRLQAGPFPSRNAAGEAVTQLRDSLRIAPMVVERR
ncbi:septal ring lytic transglycosylase RlpA family protein [Variovorax sp. PAMC26660]|uniref:septal ring lytic transglycosylase RlpA family protein n=1 Tax=Variovorax sp. PAMC26660 TaxID=2762322 RepID=UPI00164D00A8|nr:septal ring lytic transglycosylase RlpA family protein [Variovorax sp. PAMC26660]QNK70136.1 septal ring lytic transglycosylase RlpA family protein [Variovorax sp. PAMC26660]